MKKYYLHNGTEQQGPFTLEELTTKSIDKYTLIWYEGLEDWIPAEKVDELKDLLNRTEPPVLTNKQTPPSPPIQKESHRIETTHSSQPSVENKKKSNRGITITIFLILIVGGFAFFETLRNGSAYETGVDTYQQKVLTVEEIEQSQPTVFLQADGNYNENFWGTKIKVHGVITNSATVATYKDAVVRVTYYSKTKTNLGSNDYTIYESFPPHSTTNFELKIKNYKDVNSIGWEVVSAVAN